MKIKDLEFIVTKHCDSDIKYTAKTELGRFTVVDRLTGFDYLRDVETGFKDNNNLFWLASGNFDIREFPELTLEDAIYEIKQHSNNCKGI